MSEVHPGVADALRAFDGLKPWEGMVPLGYLADFLGVMINLRFRENLGVVPTQHGGDYQRHSLPTLASHAEGFFEVFEWVETARAARGSYVMMSLGACFGVQAVGCYKALQTINPMPAKLVLVEPEPSNVKWIHQHLQDNGIDPHDHWIIPMAMSNNNDPALFPIGSPGTGVHNLLSTNQAEEREKILSSVVRVGEVQPTLRNLLLNNSTGLARDVGGINGQMAEVKYISCITLGDILAPFDHVDYIEADLQMSETIVFPPFMELLKRKVRRIHIGTHGIDAHEMITNLFATAGWNIIFNFAPFKVHQTDAGNFKADDGILSLLNPLYDEIPR